MSDPLQIALKSLNQLFLKYCAEVEENVQLALQSFLKTEPENVSKVMEKDREIDQLEIEVEEECLRIMAMFQPLAKDLRLIVGILKMNNDLERIGDLAVNIVKKINVFTTQETSLSKEGVSLFLPEMVKKVKNMLRKSLDSFSTQDPKLAREVCKIDSEVDDLKHKMNAVLINKIQESPEQAHQFCSLQKNVSHLERIADLSTNIAEDVIYQVEGDIVRHGRGVYDV